MPAWAAATLMHLLIAQGISLRLGHADPDVVPGASLQILGRGGGELAELAPLLMSNPWKIGISAPRLNEVEVVFEFV